MLEPNELLEEYLIAIAKIEAEEKELIQILDRQEQIILEELNLTPDTLHKPD